MIVEVEAKFSCDDCGTEFIVQLDPGYSQPNGWSVFDVAEDAIRAGLSYRDGTDRVGPASSGCVVDGRHYCARCAEKGAAT